MRRWIANGILVGVGAVLAFSSAAVAVTTAPKSSSASTNGSAGQGLEISPPVIELSADPGQTVTATIRVRNVTTGELIAKGRTDDFGAGTDEGGQPKILIDEPGSTRYSMRQWVSGVPDLRLAPQEMKSTTIKIAVPKNAEPGGHFGVVRFTAVPPDLQGTGVALSASVGTLVLLKVSGQVVDKLSVAEFAVGKTKETVKDSFVKQGFFEHGPVSFMVRLKNEGTVHEKATGKIEITNMFGAKVGEVPVNKNGGNVLPDSIRRFEEKLDKKQLFGFYTAKMSLTYSGDKKLESKTTFWVIPWKLILLALIGLVVLVFLLRLAIRKYNDHIIAKARRR